MMEQSTVCIDKRHVFPGSVSAAFSYITDLGKWPEYWPDFVRLDECSEIKWGEPGARVNVVILLLNRETTLEIELQAFENNQFVKYISRQNGLPEIEHERHFIQTTEGTEFRLIMTYRPRQGMIGFFDRYLLKYSILKAIRKTLRNLDRRLG